ncbi:hypothetical protein COV11_01460, partial [Candidatus Woesearchaeota archaeon CG10_big_fil_rev_8_21_14_0_10_30_7]
DKHAKIAYHAKNEKNELIQVRKTWGMVPFDVQVLGGIFLHNYKSEQRTPLELEKLFKNLKEQFVDSKKHKGNVVEMVTGEGKTLTAVLPAYLNALTGKGVHIVTVNDYLAQRDRDWMSPLYKLLGVKVGVIQDGMECVERREQYLCDVTYGSNTQFGFDYLRDQIKNNKDDQVQRGHNFAIIDEVDSILIDEARTPHIISGQRDLIESEKDAVIKSQDCFKLLKKGKKEKVDEEEIEFGDYIIDEHRNTVVLTEKGFVKAKNFFKVSDDEFCHEWMFKVEQAIKANELFKLGKEYVVQPVEIFKNENGELIQSEEKQVVIVDESTGRLMPGRTWSDGLHEAIEAKERHKGVKVSGGSKTLASITLPKYFELYDKLSGMTGTAYTSSGEFWKVYGLDTIVLPTNKPLIRKDHDDQVYITKREKVNALIEDVLFDYMIGRPQLIGTASVKSSEELYQILTQVLKYKNLEDTIDILNAKPENADREVEILSNAGRLQRIVIATNMAGRGADIVVERETLDKVADNYLKYAKMQLEQSNCECVEFLVQNSFEYYLLQDAVERNDNYLNFFFPEKTNDFKKPVSVKATRNNELSNETVLSLNFETGLSVKGTERHDSRRVDNQFRGRTGRQGFPGSSKFYLSLEDDIMAHFPPWRIERLKKALRSLGMSDGEPVSHWMINKSIQSAQSRIETRDADIRKYLLDYDEPVDKVRKIFYDVRQKLLEGKIDEFVTNCAEQVLSERFQKVSVQEEYQEDLNHAMREFEQEYATLKKLAHPASLNLFSSRIFQIMDDSWSERLKDFDMIRSGIGFVGYAQQDPVIEFKKRISEDTQNMFSKVYDEVYNITRSTYILEVNKPVKTSLVINGIEDLLTLASLKETPEEVKQFARNLLRRFKSS